jgi:hypothetical protein
MTTQFHLMPRSRFMELHLHSQHVETTLYFLHIYHILACLLVLVAEKISQCQSCTLSRSRRHLPTCGQPASVTITWSTSPRFQNTLLSKNIWLVMFSCPCVNLFFCTPDNLLTNELDFMKDGKIIGLLEAIRPSYFLITHRK